MRVDLQQRICDLQEVGYQVTKHSFPKQAQIYPSGTPTNTHRLTDFL